MAENKPGPVRVEEPVGFDNPPTERIPVPGDLSDRRMDAEPLERRADEPRDDFTQPTDDSLKPHDNLAEPYDDSLKPRDDLVEPATDPVEPVAEPVPAPGTGSAGSPAATTLFDDGAADGFRNRWRELQAGFVDDPAQAVRAADELVDEIMRELAERRQSLGDQWRDGSDDTEELRVVIQEYRAFFNQLLNS